MMGEDNVVHISKFSNNGELRGPKELLEDALAKVNDGVFDGMSKMIVLTVDESDDQYKVYWMQSGMKMSECITLCEIAKIDLLQKMNYIPETE